jgi:hypothetical protein
MELVPYQRFSIEFLEADVFQIDRAGDMVHRRPRSRLAEHKAGGVAEASVQGPGHVALTCSQRCAIKMARPQPEVQRLANVRIVGLWNVRTDVRTRLAYM